jgi:hypothetical protein
VERYAAMKTSFNIFVSYAAEDQLLCEELKKQLAALIRLGFEGISQLRKPIYRKIF